MLGELDVALRRERSAPEYRKTLHVVRDRLREMVDLTEDLMLLTRAQEGRGDAAAPELPLRSLLERSVARFSPMAADRQVTVLLEPDDPEALVYGDDRLLARIFDNLISNAIFYNRPGGTVVVRSRLERIASNAWVAPQVVVSVEDTGVGIPEAAWEQVFDRFLRLDSSRSRRTGGAGLGLSIARAVAELYGGRVSIVKSSSEGTTFEVRLPGRTRVSLAELHRQRDPHADQAPSSDEVPWEP
jgi:signal transduction histidine kinase